LGLISLANRWDQATKECDGTKKASNSQANHMKRLIYDSWTLFHKWNRDWSVLLEYKRKKINAA
tara:strand:+ start:17736 stop:17927 length:192 start_codon:yes stop_codon:yes gene_type:complete